MRRLAIVTVLLLLLLLECSPLYATNYFVDDSRPDDSGDGLSWATAKKTIQAGINLATSGDTVYVADGTYKGTGNINLSFGGAPNDFTVTATNPLSAVIDGGEQDVRGIIFNNSETSSSVFTGFVIQNCWTSYSGGGIRVDGSAPSIKNCWVRNNRSTSNGGGFYALNTGANPNLSSCLITDNHADNEGGGIHIDSTSSGVSLLNVTISGNDASSNYGGIRINTEAVITNCIIYGNAGGVYENYLSDITPTYSLYDYANTVDDIPGANCIDGGSTDPLFVDSSNNDFHLRSTSPCIDEGVVNRDITTDLDGNPRPRNGQLDIGAYEYQTGSSGYYEWYVRSSGGSYGNEDGTSYKNAWDGFSNITWGTGGVEAGDTLWVCGTFDSEQLSPGINNASGPDIIIRGDCSGDPGVFDGGATTIVLVNLSSDDHVYIKDLTIQDWAGNGYPGITVTNSDNVTLDSVIIAGGNDNNIYGVRILGDSANTRITNCTISEVQIGVRIQDSSGSYPSNTHIDNNTIYNLNQGNLAGADGIAFIWNATYGVQDFTGTIIEDNEIYNFADQGIDVSGTQGIVIQRNYIHDNIPGGDGDGIKLDASSGTTQVVVRNNLISGVTHYGIYCGIAGGEISNNTIYDCDVNGINQSSAADDNALTIKNNIISTCGTTGDDALINYTSAKIASIDYNCYHNPGANIARVDGTNYTSWTTYQSAVSPFEVNSKYSDPLFIDPSGTSNFHLRSTSPCIDAGTLDSGVTLSDRDFLGRPRIRRQVPDIGAIEWTHRPIWILEGR